MVTAVSGHTVYSSRMESVTHGIFRSCVQNLVYLILGAVYGLCLFILLFDIYAPYKYPKEKMNQMECYEVLRSVYLKA